MDHPTSSRCVRSQEGNRNVFSVIYYSSWLGESDDDKQIVGSTRDKKCEVPLRNHCSSIVTTCSFFFNFLYLLNRAHLSVFLPFPRIYIQSDEQFRLHNGPS